ncbi:Galactose/methyl galactoside import ATP-binding protein MglA [Planctomycetes bacterium CA13]|uniref:Galactose/methyl galactoside import ATP-binding protein MglA n=1 Tax=Novipirellula herctigrandis TaxID=2527986 RepID=A0A5C5Z416_9BACT|nr:Galactose/methyl galactoside import ATP-binding protein MglA [Planctomycetes bacterium CA13]
MDETSTPTALLVMQGISKTFPGVRALSDVDFEVRSGEVHALMGENGAGKSTLIKVLTGVHRRDSGSMTLDQHDISPQAPIEAERLGISTVYQEVNLIPQLSVAENIMLGRQSTTAGWISWKAIRQRAQQAVDRVDLSVDIDCELRRCSTAVQQMVAIARAVDLDAKLLVLDEPTSSLDTKEVEELFKVLLRLRESNIGIVLVTHFLNQVYRIADRITVLRNGQRVGTYATEQLPRIELVGKMLGKAPQEVAEIESRTATVSDTTPSSEKMLEVSQLGRKGTVEPFDLDICRGEVVGLAGLLGSGRTEAVRLLFGLDRATTGKLKVDGKRIDKPTPRKAIRAGVAFCPEDRKREGVILDLSVRENIMLALQASRGLSDALSYKQQLELSQHYIDALKIKTPSTETPVGNLSGGNQQKVLLARWLAMNPKVMILDEPTRGIDVGAKAEMETLIESLRKRGMAVVLISSELEEMARTCQRVSVMRDRMKVGELANEDVTDQKMMEMIAQHHDD